MNPLSISNLLHNPETGQLYKEGEILRQPQLANTETRDALISEFKGMKVHSFPPPASGSVLSLVFNILGGKLYQCNMLQSHAIVSAGYDLNEIDSLAYHRIVEAYKFGYGQRLSLGDPDYNETIYEVKI